MGVGLLNLRNRGTAEGACAVTKHELDTLAKLLRYGLNSDDEVLRERATRALRVIEQLMAQEKSR